MAIIYSVLPQIYISNKYVAKIWIILPKYGSIGGFIM